MGLRGLHRGGAAVSEASVIHKTIEIPVGVNTTGRIIETSTQLSERGLPDRLVVRLDVDPSGGVGSAIVRALQAGEWCRVRIEWDDPKKLEEFMTDAEEAILKTALHAELNGVVITTLRGAIDLCEREALASALKQPGAVSCAMRLRNVLREYESRNGVRS